MPALSKNYTDEQLNYFRICYVTTDLMAEGLREIFKQEWAKRYKPWTDAPQDGMDFFNGESPKNQKKNARLLTTMKKGDTGKWDCTMLFYAILFSDCLRPHVTVEKTVHDLRNFRNEQFAHRPEGSLSDTDFQNAISKVLSAFQALGLQTSRIKDVKNEKTFSTEELQKILEKVNDLKQELTEKEDQRQVLADQLQKEAPSFCILPPKPLHVIGCRAHEVHEIDQKMRELKESSDELSYLYISGNPGSGKSQLAGLVAKRFYDKVKEMPGASSFVMTLNAATLNSLLESYASFARQLKCPDDSVTKTLLSKDCDIEEKIVYLKMLIAAKITCYKSWLLVVDNVTNLSSVHVHLPQAGDETWAKGQLLITTQDTSSISSESVHISVSKGMKPDDAISLLAEISGIHNSRLSKKVAEDLDFQPLALSAAAVFVKEIRQDKALEDFGWLEFLNILEEGKRGTTEEIHAKTNLVYPKTMTKTIGLAVENLIKCDKFLKHFFTLLSLCAPQPLKVDIAVDYIISLEEHVNETDKPRIRMSFRRCSLLLFEGDSIRVHQIVYDVSKTVINDQEKCRNLETINGAVSSFHKFIIDTFQEHFEVRRSKALETMHIVPHLKAFIEELDDFFSNDSRGQVQSMSAEKIKKLGDICDTHSEFNEAKNYFELALTIEETELGPSHINLATTYSYLAVTHQCLGNFQEAENYQRRALTIQLEKHGKNHVDVATSYSNLASIHQDLGDLKKAKEYQQCSLTIRLEKLGKEHIEVATSYNNLALIHQDLGDLNEAKVCLERALDIELRTLGPEDVDVAASYSNLALIYQDLGELKLAKKFQQHALDIEIKQLGAEHVDVATSYSNLASIHQDLGDLEQAMDCQQRALSIEQGKLGREHVAVATSYSHLALIHRDLGDFKQAKEYQQRALDIELEKLGPEHVDVAKSYTNLAVIHQDLGDLEQAKEYQIDALTTELKNLDSEHFAVAKDYSNLASIHRDLGDLMKAKEYQQRALDIQSKKLGREHVDVAKSYSNFALIYRDLGDLKKAKEYQELALNIQLDKLGEEHFTVAKNYSNFASIYRDLGDLKKAKEYQQRALDIQSKKLGREHVDVAKSYSNFALIYRDLGDLKKAKEYQELALNIQLDKLGEEHFTVVYFDYIIFVSLVIFALYYIWPLLKYLNILLNTLTAIYFISSVLNL